MHDLLRKTLLPPLLLLAGMVACTSSGTSTPAPTHTTFGVFSDPHLLDAAALGASGTDFDHYLDQDRKMIAQSEETLDETLADLMTRKLDFVLVTGDLTKDGEQVDHQLMALKLAQLRATGTKVFVIPGNHDINNPNALSYLTSPPMAVPQVTPAEFKQIYTDCGFRTALAQDPNSLSYVAEPVPGLWLFALDSAKYATNLTSTPPAPVTSGAFSPATQTWILNNLQLAKRQGKAVIGMMHHGIVEHFAGQATFFPEYLLDDYATVGKTLSDAGLNLVFTGHFHANDISMKDFGTSKLYDCETGSTVTAPCPYRIVSADLGTLTYQVTTSHVLAIPSHMTDFVSFETSFLQAGLQNLEMAQLTSPPYSLNVPTASVIAPLITAGMMAHYAGDENLTDPATIGTLTSMISSPDPTTKQVGQFISSLWTDLGPGDNNSTISLK